MVSKNNVQFYDKKNDNKQRWGLRKTSFGMASLLLGTSFVLFNGAVVHADTPSNDKPVVVTTIASNSSAVEAETASASSSSAVKAETTSASSSSAVEAETASASSSSAAKADTTSAASSSAVNYTKDPVAGANVTAKYVDGAGNTISDNVVKSGNIGDDYSTDQKAIPGYTFKAVNGNPTGEFINQEQTVTYIYTKDPVAGRIVTVKYVDEAGHILDYVEKSGNIGDDYSTDQKAIPGYTFKAVQGNPTGQFTSDAQTVTYVYTQDVGNVTVKYVDLDGNTISDNVVVSGNFGDHYIIDQKAIPGYTFIEVQGASYGRFTSDAQTVTYVYTQTRGLVKVFYVAKYVGGAGGAGYPLSDNVKYGIIGDSYTTEQKAFPGYTFREVQGNPTGQFTSDAQTVTYVYTQDGGNVTVKYVDGAGNTISDNVVVSGNVSYSYTTEQKAIPGYTFTSVQGNPTGRFIEQEQTVTYVYIKDPVARGHVTVMYVDGAGHILGYVEKSGNIGDDYSTDQKAIPGYTFKAVQGNPTGQFTSDDQTVIYVYTKDPVAGGNVTVKYVDWLGNTISDDVVKSGNIGDDYSIDQKAIPGYTFKAVAGNPTGQFYLGAQTVTYVYTKDPVAGGNVTVKYVDEAGNTISDNVVKSGNIRDSYTTEQKSIPGYTFKEVQGSASGKFTAQDQTVYYVYTKNAPTMTTEKKTVNETVSYVDQNGNVLANKHTASVDFTRQVSTDAVTGEKTYGSWSADQSFAAVTSPELKGYTADKAQIDKQTVNGDSKDLEFKVTYTKTPGNGTDTGNSSSNQPGNPSQPSNATNNGVINTSTNTGSKVNNGAVNSPELPQTGENNSQTMSFIGILLAMFGSLLGFLGIKKRRND